MQTNTFSFRMFKESIEKLMILDNLEDDIKEEYINEWYIIFKENKHKSVFDFVEFQFPLSEVNKETHNYWKRDLFEGCKKCGNTGRCGPPTLGDPDGQECDCNFE